MKNKIKLKEKFNIIEKIKKKNLFNDKKKNKKQTNKNLQNSIEIADFIEQKDKKVAISTVIFMILVLFIAGCSIGKSITEYVLQSKAEIAIPILEVSSNPKINITAVNNIGEYKFKVTNFKENKISDVNLRYYIEIKANVDDSVRFLLYRNNQEMNLQNLCSEYVTTEKGKKQEDNYILKIIYDKNKSSNVYDIIEKIQVKVHSEQEKL